MISSYFQGGLGNQMFQIAAAVSLAEDNGDSTVFNMAYHDLPKQGRKCHNYLNSILRNVNFSSHYNPSSVYNEPHYHYNEIPYSPNLCLVGYFQSEKYFSHNDKLIRELFSIDDDSEDLIQTKYGDILNKNPISVHIRRGDYLSSAGAHPTCTREYYNAAFELFPDGSNYLFFSDDISWCKENFAGDNYHFSEGNEDFIDLYLMSKCSHNIIANSSFSWWAAWLNNNPNKRVISPRNWFGGNMNHNTKDVRPSSWEII
jgi:hypothetical protein